LLFYSAPPSCCSTFICSLTCLLPHLLTKPWASGNLAIHWRVLPAAPAATALALSAWAPNVTAAAVFAENVAAAFALPAGHPALASLAAAFAAVDDSATVGWSTWVDFDLGTNVPASDAAVNASYAFIEHTLAPLRPLVAGEPIAALATSTTQRCGWWQRRRPRALRSAWLQQTWAASLRAWSWRAWARGRSSGAPCRRRRTTLTPTYAWISPTASRSSCRLARQQCRGA
jgi:hypothetical protein